MKVFWRIAVVVVLAVVVGLVVMAKQDRRAAGPAGTEGSLSVPDEHPGGNTASPASRAAQHVPDQSSETRTVLPGQSKNTPTTLPASTSRKLPRLVDLGASKCIPCKMMAPILESLKTEYAGRLEVEFIDVWENRQAARQYNIRAIPTQIFFAPDGKELYRHEGFFSKDDILNKWKELGFDFSKPRRPER